MKKARKWIGVLLLSPVLLFLILAALIYVPPIQNWLVERVAAIASEETGLSISVGHVSISFPLDLEAEDVLVMQQGDTVAAVRSVTADVALWPLLKNRVEVEELQLDGVQLNTLELISDLLLKGNVDHLVLASPVFDLEQEIIQLSQMRLEDTDLTVMLTDTAAIDTTSESAQWQISFDQFNIARTRVNLILYGDSTMFYMGEAQLEGAQLDLGVSDFRLNHLEWQDGQLALAGIADIDDLNVRLDSFLFADPRLQVLLRELSLHERRGFTVTEGHGGFRMDDEAVLQIDDLLLRTPASHLRAQTNFDLDVLDSLGVGQIQADIDASVGRSDVAQLFGPLPFNYPVMPFTLQAHFQGNSHQASLEQFTASLPTIFDIEASGQLANISDPDHLQANIDLMAQTWAMTPVLQLLDVSPSELQLPERMKIEGSVDVDGSAYEARLQALLGEARALVDGRFDAKSMAYEGTVNVDQLPLSRYLPQTGLHLLTGEITARGQGFDPMVATTRLEAHSVVRQLLYDDCHLDSMVVTAQLDDGLFDVCLESHNRLVDGELAFNGSIDGNRMKGNFMPDLRWLDFYGLHLKDDPLTVGLNGNLEVESDFDKTHLLKGRISGITLRDSVKTHQVEDLGVLLRLRTDTTIVRLQSGNLIFKLDGQGHYEQLLSKLTLMGDSALAQLDDKRIDYLYLKQQLPVMSLTIDCGRQNPLADILRASAGMEFKDSKVTLTASPQKGINGRAVLYGLKSSDIQLDTLTMRLKDTLQTLTYGFKVSNNRKNPMMVFAATLDGVVTKKGFITGMHYYDAQHRLGVRIGANATMEDGGLRLHLVPERPLLGYKEFQLNDDNFIFLPKQGKLTAKVDLVADDGTGVKVYSSSQDSTLMQDLTVSVNHLDLGQLTSWLPILPSISGHLNGDFHLTQNLQEQMSLATDMNVQQLKYEGIAMGNIGGELVYLQRENDTHAISGTLTSDGREIGLLNGELRAKDEGEIAATIQLIETPLTLFNGFFEDQFIGLDGQLDGVLTISGTTSKPVVNGSLTPGTPDHIASLAIPAYGVTFYLDPEPINIDGSRLEFVNFPLYTSSNRRVPNAINVQGNVDFSVPDSLRIRLHLLAKNCQLINAKQTASSIAYGKMFVNFAGRIIGGSEYMMLRGQLDVLGTTDLTYLLLDSPLSTDNQLDELVRFTDFNDSTVIVVERPAPDGVRATLDIGIDERAHVKVALNAEQTNYVDLYGGGNLRMRMRGDDLSLTGRYTVSEGSSMKYSLPIIPLKTFTIRDGSYVDFTGDAGNPRLNLTAVEQVRTSVGDDEGQARTVAFQCGVQITKTLANMGIAFTVEAPEDMSVSSELAALTEEQRSKVAVTMLTTGMYIVDGSTGNFSMNTALSSFLESEINNITSGALKTVDLQVGLNNTTDASGNVRTDYSFKFAKRFWNNRLNVQIGGKVSTGSEMQQGKESFFDNVTMEYRLSPTSNQYVKLFYNQDSYDWLDGYTSEYGGGFIWKRRLSSFWNIFRLKEKPRPEQPRLQPDSLDSLRERVRGMRPGL